MFKAMDRSQRQLERQWPEENMNQNHRQCLWQKSTKALASPLEAQMKHKRSCVLSTRPGSWSSCSNPRPADDWTDSGLGSAC